jgi:hypothetical protein
LPLVGIKLIMLPAHGFSLTDLRCLRVRMLLIYFDDYDNVATSTVYYLPDCRIYVTTCLRRGLGRQPQLQSKTNVVQLFLVLSLS